MNTNNLNDPAVVLRFAVMSDLHYDMEHPKSRERFDAAMKAVYSYAEKQEYKELDALYVVGDFTNRGLPEEFEMFKEDCGRLIRPKTKLVVTLANHELHYHSDVGAMKKFTELFNMPFDRHEVIRGYHFISLSTMQYQGKWHDSFDENKRSFLRNALEQAHKANDGKKPIFVFQHPGIPGTVIGGVFGNSELAEILRDYPEVIDFSGHSHCSVNDPKEIDQKDFTTVSTGSLYDICQTHKTALYPYINRVMRESCEYAHMLVVEADADGKVRIKRLDVIAGDFFEGDWLLERSGDRSAFVYTDERKKSAEPPYFEAPHKLSACLEDGKLKISFTAAKGVSERVKEYHISLSDESGEFYKTIMATDYPALVQEKNIELTIEDLEKEHFTVSIRAGGFWDTLSDAISTEI